MELSLRILYFAVSLSLRDTLIIEDGGSLDCIMTKSLSKVFQPLFMIENFVSFSYLLVSPGASVLNGGNLILLQMIVKRSS